MENIKDICVIRKKVVTLRAQVVVKNNDMHTPIRIKNNKSCLSHPWHPSVVYVQDGWNGFKFWMAQTPYPPYDIVPYADRYELPCIHFSNDGKEWHSIKANPIDDLSEDMINNHNYYSDPHLLLRGDIMECYYRLSVSVDKYTHSSKTLLLKRYSGDGVNWSDSEIVADLRNEDDVYIWGEQIISQSIIWDGKCYKCWYVDRSGCLHGRKISLTTSLDGKHWDKFNQCQIENVNLDPWHIDVQYYDNKYQMLVFDMHSLIWLESDDGITFTYVSNVLEPSRLFLDFYSEGLYRACSVKIKDEIFVYFSAKNEKRTSIGLLKTKNRLVFQHVDGISKIRYVVEYIFPILSYKKCKYLIKKWIKKILKL